MQTLLSGTLNNQKLKWPKRLTVKMTGFSKIISPGQKPSPDFQGNASTCTSHGVGKALTGGLYYGRFGTVLDVFQDGVVNALIQLRKNVGGCWPDEFNKKSILAYDRTSFEYYTLGIRVEQCTFPELQHNWHQSSFVVVYNSPQDSHCIYVDRVENGKLCCLNSHGNTDGFPQLKPEEVTAIYQVSASVKKAPEKTQVAQLRQEVTEKNKIIEELEMLAKMEEANTKLEENQARGPHKPFLGQDISHTLILGGTFASVFRNNSYSLTHQVSFSSSN